MFRCAGEAEADGQAVVGQRGHIAFNEGHLQPELVVDEQLVLAELDSGADLQANLRLRPAETTRALVLAVVQPIGLGKREAVQVAAQHPGFEAEPVLQFRIPTNVPLDRHRCLDEPVVQKARPHAIHEADTVVVLLFPGKAQHGLAMVRLLEELAHLAEGVGWLDEPGLRFPEQGSDLGTEALNGEEKGEDQQPEPEGVHGGKGKVPYQPICSLASKVLFKHQVNFAR